MMHRHIALLGLVALGSTLAVSVPARSEAPPNRYSIDAQIVVDNQTKLAWQQRLRTDLVDWATARSYCESLQFRGGGWRLPSYKELMTLVDFAASAPTLDVRAFPGTPSAWFWSVTEHRRSDGTLSPWHVDFASGRGSYSSIDAKEPAQVRCVRSADAP